MRFNPFYIPLLLVLSSAPLPALQTPAFTGVAAVDSSAVARDAWRSAAAALRSSDTAAAFAHVGRAAAAWPGQPAYLVARARLAAMLGRDAALLEMIALLTRYESGAALATDAAVGARARAEPRVAEAIALLARASAPRVASTVAGTIADTTVYPEGVDADPRTGRLYVTSIRNRTIYEVSPDGAVRDLAVNRHERIGAIMGVRVDRRAGVLWATTVGLPQMAGWTPADSTIAALLRIRISDGTVERRWDLPPEAAGHVPGDLALAPAGDVYVTDSRAPVVYRLVPGAAELRRYTDPLFRSLQGVAVTPDGNAVYLADWSHGLFRLDPVSGRVERLAESPGITSLGVDGIVLHRGAIIGVQNGVAPARIVRFTLATDGRSITRAEVLDRAWPDADEPTIGTLLGDDFVYVANSQWDKYDDSGARRAGTRLAPTQLRRLPLPR